MCAGRVGAEGTRDIKEKREREKKTRGEGGNCSNEACWGI